MNIPRGHYMFSVEYGDRLARLGLLTLKSKQMPHEEPFVFEHAQLRPLSRETLDEQCQMHLAMYRNCIHSSDEGPEGYAEQAQEWANRIRVGANK